MCLSRAEEIDGICIVQPYAPNLFCKGDLPGPDLLLKFWRGEIKQEDLEGAWRKQSKNLRKPKDWDWCNEMPLYCRGCSETANVEVYKAAKEFPKHGFDHLWDRVIALGMERFCTRCSEKRKAAAGKEIKESGSLGRESRILGKACGILGGRPLAEEVKCTKCKQILPCSDFNPAKLQKWRQLKHVPCDAQCLRCEVGDKPIIAGVATTSCPQANLTESF